MKAGVGLRGNLKEHLKEGTRGRGPRKWALKRILKETFSLRDPGLLLFSNVAGNSCQGMQGWTINPEPKISNPT